MVLDRLEEKPAATRPFMEWFPHTRERRFWPQSTLIQADHRWPPHRELLSFTVGEIKILICCFGAALQNMFDYGKRQ